MIDRIIYIPLKYSFFLFGPRGVGKTTLLNTILPKEKTYTIDLLNPETETLFLRKPGELAHTLAALPQSTEWVVIDEVQKTPHLLNEVQRQLVNKTRLNFAMTGSSARKLKRGQANLLAGRASTHHLFPLTSLELKEKFNLDEALMYGTLPEVINRDDTEEKKAFLRSYANTYLREEIQMEGIVRNLTGFKKFLPLISFENGNILSWTNIASEIGIDAKTVQSYFQILEDTLIGFFLPAYAKSLRKKQKTHPKFYLFDTGVKRALEFKLTVPLTAGTIDYGRAFEHFWITEIVRISSYQQNDFQFSYFATPNSEIDLVVERPNKPVLFIAIKSSHFVKAKDIRALNAVAQAVPDAKAICISQDPMKRRIGNVLICPYQEALKEAGLVVET